MAKSKQKSTQTKPKAPVKNAQGVQNGLADGIGFPTGGPGSGFPFNQGSPYTEQLSNVNTIFKNLRWYLISNFRQVLSEAYVELGLIQTIVDVPVDDALRGGVDIKSKQLDEDQIQELQAVMDREDDLNTAGQAAKWNRLFGGAGILIITDQVPTAPLDIVAIKKDSPLEFRAVDMWELFWDKQNTDGYDAELQETEYEFYDYYSKKVHISRVMKMKGLQAPSFIRPRLRGWGFSVVEKLVRSINQYLKATDLGFEVLDEFKLDVYKIKNLTNTLLSPNGSQKVHERIRMANWQKNFQNAIVMDSEDDFLNKQLSFAGLAEAMAGIRMQVASDMRIPLTKLFGISAAGFNSGEDDIEVYNSMIESEVRGKLKYDLLRMIEIRCQQLFDFVPDDLQIAFKPLRVMTSEQEENVKTAKFNRILAAKQGGEITTFEFREAVNKENLLGITLDTTGDHLNPDDPDVASLIDGENKDINQDPGADRDPSERTIGEDEEHDEKELKAVSPGRPSTLAPPKTPSAKNSLEYDKAAYEVDSAGHHEMDLRRAEFVKDPALFDACKAKAEAAYGSENLGFAMWLYQRAGGKV